MQEVLNRIPTGVVTPAWLDQHGADRAVISRALRRGMLRQLRRGWYATPEADPDVVRAIRFGGALSGPHALRRHGAWVPPGAQLQIVRFSHHPTRGSLLAQAHNARVQEEYGRAMRAVAPFGVAPWRMALQHCVRTLDLPDAVVVADGMLHAARAQTLAPHDHLDEQLIREALQATARGRKIESLTDANSESIIESYPRVWLTLRGYRVKIQFRLHSNERVDIVIEDIIALELDGRHHGDPLQYLKDHAKAARTAIAGLIPLRFSYQQVIEHWDLVLEAIETLLARFCPGLLLRTA